MTKQVRVEIGENNLPKRIFRKDKKWLELDFDQWMWMEKSDAVALIRLQVFQRTGGEVFAGETVRIGNCEECERPITWDNMEMHERIFKGKGGEVSLENCMALCSSCHQTGPNAKHKDRRWQTAKLNPRA